MIRTMRQLIWSMDEVASVTIHYPSPMTPEELKDAEEIVAIWLRGLKREVLAEGKENRK